MALDSFLSNRTFRVKVGSSFSRPVEVLSGVPQGSVLGPLLFVAYTADLKNTLKSQFAMYADDIKSYNSSSNAVLLKEDFLPVYKWSIDWLLPLNIDKCKVLYIGKKKPKVSYYIDGIELTKSDCCRDLGVLVSSDLSWSNQVVHVTKRASSMLFLLSKVFCKIISMVFLKL